MFKIIYVSCAVAASLCFLWLAYTGPPPPLARHVYLPELEQRPMFLLRNASYRPFEEESAAKLWNEILPANGGAVLATNITSGFHLWAVPAMFHQLRCLREIRTKFIELSLPGADSRRFMSYRGLAHLIKTSRTALITFDSILCHADTTLHPVAQLTPEQKIIDGNALWHMCRDHSVLYRWADMSGPAHKDYLIREHPIAAPKKPQ
ncbi:hypothetical protein PT974_02041 [Cladobotryum mycophilum]|uniref:Uncharacterized protein n=1 Tax=Cladobotryum mycophilum TaxID=491253 RepID=A0ABR0SX03_9HYPO